MCALLSFCMMTAEHVSSVWEIEKGSFSSPWSRESFEMELDNDHARYVIAKEGEEVVGYAGYWRIYDEAHVTNVAIRKDRRGKGYGKALMIRLMDLAAAEGVGAMTLEVRVTNLTARHLYDELGFLSAGVRPGYYEDNGEDAVIMWNTSYFRAKAGGRHGIV